MARSLSPSVMVAENRPVRRCLGRRAMIDERTFEKPISNSLKKIRRGNRSQQEESGLPVCLIKDQDFEFSKIEVIKRRQGVVQLSRRRDDNGCPLFLELCHL